MKGPGGYYRVNGAHGCQGLDSPGLLSCEEARAGTVDGTLLSA
jgi:hypothetical protein